MGLKSSVKFCKNILLQGGRATSNNRQRSMIVSAGRVRIVENVQAQRLE